MTKLNEAEIVDLFVNLKRDDFKSQDKDDVVIIPIRKIGKISEQGIVVLKSDMLVESTDVPKAMRPWQIARKSIVACVSDLAAKGIRSPYICLISVGIPPKYSNGDILELVKGFGLASKEFGVNIVGGDTNRSEELVINCNIFAISKSSEKIPKRKGAKPGDYVIISGQFGYPAAGLKILTGNVSSTEKFRQHASSSVLMPKPQQRFGVSLAKYFSSSIDSSDGLAISLYELAMTGKIDLLIDTIPSAQGVKQFAADNKIGLKELVFYGGEEYEIVATIPRRNLKRAKALATHLKIKLHVIGIATKGSGKVYVLNPRGQYTTLGKYGYVHQFDL